MPVWLDLIQISEIGGLSKDEPSGFTWPNSFVTHATPSWASSVATCVATYGIAGVSF
jgi:hypothetical protein